MNDEWETAGHHAYLLINITYGGHAEPLNLNLCRASRRREEEIYTDRRIFSRAARLTAGRHLLIPSRRLFSSPGLQRILTLDAEIPVLDWMQPLKKKKKKKEKEPTYTEADIKDISLMKVRQQQQQLLTAQLSTCN